MVLLGTICWSVIVAFVCHIHDIFRDFPTPDVGPNIGSFPIEIKQKHPKMMKNIPNQHFGKKFMKIGQKKRKDTDVFDANIQS